MFKQNFNYKLYNKIYSIKSFIRSKSNNSLVPETPASLPISKCKQPEDVQLDLATVQLIEHLSLVRFTDQEGEKRLKEAISFAEQLFEVNTENVEPLYTVQENRPLKLRDDLCTVTNCRKSILKTASKAEENYFVAPPGNIPLDHKEK